jgi:1,4-dihydroxy-2-naphthoate octaprenyltransferase
MKNPVIFYLVIALGVIALAVGIFYLATGGHPAREYAGLGAGVVLLIAGIAGTFMTRSKGAVS